jgi:hypothetical protein
VLSILIVLTMFFPLLQPSSRASVGK